MLGPQLVIETADATVSASVRGSLRNAVRDGTELPAVGDWVIVEADNPEAVSTVLPRRSALVRKQSSGETLAQVIAANVDLVLVVVSLSAGPRVRGVERYLTMAWESGAVPIVALTKADLIDDVDERMLAVADIAVGVEVMAVSCVTGAGIDELAARIGAGTAVLVGRSGVGKSTLINRLRGDEEIRTQDIRADQKGRHTTTHRELHRLPGGGMIIDSPGLRALQLWHGDDGLDRTFGDVIALEADCRFSDCTHRSEPGCAVAAAIAAGALLPERVAAYRKIERELRAVEIRANVRARGEHRRNMRVMTRALRKMPSKR
jgi:ribosome biogenesis GTPase